MRYKTNKLWSVPKETLQIAAEQSTTFTQIFSLLGLPGRGTTHYQRLKTRLQEEGIDFSHIKCGKGSNQGRKFIVKKIPLDDVLIENSTYSRYNLKRRLLSEEILENKCSNCKCLPMWDGKPLVLILDHVNGIYNDNRLKNLRLLCPNCNSQTDTFCGKNKSK